MSGDIKFYLEQSGVRDGIYSNNKLVQLERGVAERALAEARAAFLIEFGFEGAFNLAFFWSKTKSPYSRAIGGVRPVYRIQAADAATGAVLKQHPKWLDKFSKNARL